MFDSMPTVTVSIMNEIAVARNICIHFLRENLYEKLIAACDIIHRFPGSFIEKTLKTRSYFIKHEHAFELI